MYRDLIDPVSGARDGLPGVGAQPPAGKAEQHCPKAPSQGFYRSHGKRLLDVSGAAILLIFFAPMMLVIAVLQLCQRTPVVFAHPRITQGGRQFPCRKFTSMVPDAEARLREVLARDDQARRQWDLYRKLDKDPRVTPLGSFLRRSSFDELPQLFNVLRGEMSLVGPRPITVGEVERYGKHIDSYLQLRPGLTGQWQVSGRNALSYEQRVLMDVAYADGLSLRGDLSILLRTVGVVLRATGK